MNRTLPIIFADQRLAERRGIKAAIFGRSGIGKTSLLWTLNPDTTLFFDLEAGDLAIEGWSGDTIRPRTWEECRDFAVFIGGANPAIPDGRPYSQRHYNEACAKFGDPGALDKYVTIFVDSITVAGRLCFQWAKEHPEAFSEKTGKPDIRSAYGLHGREMIGWITHLQHTRMSLPTSMRATNSTPSRSAKPEMRRAFCASGELSLSERPRAELRMPRTRLRPMLAQFGPDAL